LILIGAGGHAKVVLETALSLSVDVIGFLDDNAQARLFSVPYLGTLENLSSLQNINGIIAIGLNRIRQTLVQRYANQQKWLTIIYPNVIRSNTSSFGVGTVVFAGVIVQAAATVGDHVILNTGCQIDHDVCIGDFCHVAPGAILTGGVVLEEGAFVGAGAVVLPGVRIGAWSTLGAGSVATRDVPPGTVYIGAPARSQEQGGVRFC
jgi:sugar O-acyltransferase (sialic acid O-acetyltransferase NeuD family)